MENQRYENLLMKAQKNEISANDICEVVLILNDKLTNDNKEMKKAISQNTRGLRDIEEEYPLLPPEADDLAKAVKHKGVSVMGGKKSAAYQDTALRKKVYMDIYGEIKRQYGLIDEKGAQQSYKKLKRKYLKGAMSVVEEYEPPISIANEIEELNELDED